jgi:hypothetical protein
MAEADTSFNPFQFISPPKGIEGIGIGLVTVETDILKESYCSTHYQSVT